MSKVYRHGFQFISKLWRTGSWIHCPKIAMCCRCSPDFEATVIILGIRRIIMWRCRVKTVSALFQQLSVLTPFSICRGVNELDREEAAHPWPPNPPELSGNGKMCWKKQILFWNGLNNSWLAVCLHNLGKILLSITNDQNKLFQYSFDS